LAGASWWKLLGVADSWGRSDLFSKRGRHNGSAQGGQGISELATNSLGERTLASSAAVDGALFIRTETHLYKLKE